MTHVGLATMSRPLVARRLPTLLRTSAESYNVTPGVSGLSGALSGAWLTSKGRYGLTEPLTLSQSLLEARLTGRALITARDSQLAVMLDGIGFDLQRCRIGSVDRPDGSHRRPTEDGIRPCPLPGSPLAHLPSRIRDCDIVNDDGRYGSNHMDGVQLWRGGNLLICRTQITGWWQAAVMLKTDWGPIDGVTITGCYLAGANYFQIRCIDGGHGRPTNVTITGNVFEGGTRGGISPMNSGNDRCTPASQTKYVRNEFQRTNPEWIVFTDNVYPDGTAVEPPGGWLYA